MLVVVLFILILIYVLTASSMPININIRVSTISLIIFQSPTYRSRNNTTIIDTATVLFLRNLDNVDIQDISIFVFGSCF